MKTFFKELFEYNLSCNENYIKLLLDHEKHLSEKSIQLINHIVNAHHIWNNRIDPKELPYHVWEIHRFSALSLIDKNNHVQSHEIIDDFNLDKTVNYKNTKNQEFENSIRDILFHIINHSNYHRAQLASELKQLDIAPPVSDYIVYKR